MTRILLSGFLMAALTAPALGGSTDEKKPTPESRKLDEVLQQLGALRKSVDEIQDFNNALRIQQINAELQQLKARIEKLEGTVQQMSGDVGRISRSFSPPSTPAPGVVRLQNRTASGATVILNGTVIRVAPFSTETRTVPSGTINYEVMADGFLQSVPMRNSPLRPNETLTVFINP